MELYYPRFAPPGPFYRIVHCSVLVAGTANFVTRGSVVARGVARSAERAWWRECRGRGLDRLYCRAYKVHFTHMEPPVADRPASERSRRTDNGTPRRLGRVAG